jgi:serine/threonine protein kinase
MNPERYQQAGELFNAALELSPPARAAFLARVCAADAGLRAEVESLLGAHEQTGRFIDEPPAAEAARLMAILDAQARTGQLIGRYRVIRLQGKGGMGEVYLAEDTQLIRRIALKLLPPESTRDDTRVRRFIREARAASALNHPNIIAVYEIGEDAGLHYMAAEWVEGKTLREFLQGSPPSFAQILSIARQTAAALAAAHAAGIVHRDIKPENLMLRPDGLVKVLDFGLAKLISGRKTSGGGGTAGLTGPGMILGTLPYMSPERVRMLPADARSDIFSLGVLLYEMIAGRPPFTGEDTNDTINALLDSEPPPLAAFRFDTPADLQRIVSRMLCKNPAGRYQRCEELLADLQNLKQRLESGARAATRSPSRTLVINLPRAGALLPEPRPDSQASWVLMLLISMVLLAAVAMLWRLL